MRLIKKSEKLPTQNTEAMEEQNEVVPPADTINTQEEPIEENPVLDFEYQRPTYNSLRDNPVFLSVGNTGWQVSDIWKDIRLDNF